MGEQKQFRSEQARKNYEKQERQRAQAARRKELTTRRNELTGRASSWVKDNRKLVSLIAAGAALLIVLLWLGCKWFVGPGGSLPNFFGHVRGVEDTWVVTDLNPRTNLNTGSSNVDGTSYGKSPRYFHLATLDPLEGFTQDPGYTINTDKTNQDQHYISTDKNSVLESAYVFGIANKTADKHAGDMVSVMSLSNVTSDIVKATIAGHDVTYVRFVYNQDPDADGVVTEAYASLCMCIDTTKDACVLVVLNSSIVPVEQVPTMDAMLAESEVILRNLTVY